MKILIVEDDRKIASFIQKGLKEQGYVIDTCHDGDAGFDLAMGESYDVILLDIRMPDGDGLTDSTEVNGDNVTDPTNPDTDGDGQRDGDA